VGAGGEGSVPRRSARAGCGGRQRAGEEKNVGVEGSAGLRPPKGYGPQAGQRAAVNHLVDGASQEVFLWLTNREVRCNLLAVYSPVRALAQ
jgi:hypothetical protein